MYKHSDIVRNAVIL